jgi:hypothetical protein
MSEYLDLIVKLSLAVVVVEFMYRVVTRSASLLPRALMAVGLAYVAYALVPSVVETKDGLDETASIVFCYLSMVFGMIAQYFYFQMERGNRKFEFDWMTFLMPIFASPIVFIPLLTLASEVAIGGAFTREKLMVYLVAFQNGFFWKSFFEQRRGEATAPPAVLTSVAPRVS